MDYYMIEKCPTVEKSYCFLEGDPEDAEQTWRLREGSPMAGYYPEDPPPWYMRDEYPGIKLPSLIGNVSNMLIVERKLKDVIQATGVPMECLPFILYNHKKRVASKDYFIINVLGTFDCLNYEESEIDYSKEVPGEVLGVDKRVFDSRKLKEAPDIFRIKEEHVEIVISQQLAKALQQLNPTNVYLHPIETAP